MSRPYDHEHESPANRGAVRYLSSPDRGPFEVDGSLALDAAPRLKDEEASDTVPRMAWPQAPGLGTNTLRKEERARVQRARRLAALVGVACVSLLVLLLTAFGMESPTIASSTAPAPAGRLLPSGPPRPEVIAMRSTLRIQLPIDQNHVTAIGYHASGTTALALDPVGTQANAGLFGRLVHKLFGQETSGVRYYLLDGGVGPQTGGVDVGAPANTDVYAPVDGTVAGIADYVLDGRPYGVRIDVQPSGNPGVVVTVTNVRADPALRVGSTVTAAHTKIGSVIDTTSVERAGLARYTQDRGQHVHLEVHPAATLASP
jgi:murein DD-endopeptidase MepM/ murein hydrolase activator NlpD